VERAATAQAAAWQHIWSLRKNGKQVDAELRDHGEWGWECQFLYNGELAYGRR
jgi:hypothetical protein